eukprot:22416_1
MSSSSPIIIQHHLNPSFFCMLPRDTNYYNYNNHYTLNFNVQCDYIGNPKPRKRLKLTHSSTNQCNTKCILRSKNLRHSPSKCRAKSPILHHCVINERWNISLNHANLKPIQSPLLNILNAMKTHTNQAQIHVEHDTDYVQDIVYDTTPSIHGVEPVKPAHSVPVMSIQDDMQYRDTCAPIDTYLHPCAPMWNTTHYHEYKEAMHPYKQQKQDMNRLNWQPFACLLIVCAIGWRYGLFKCVLSMITIWIVGHALCVMYRECCIENEEKERLKFDVSLRSYYVF